MPAKGADGLVAVAAGAGGHGGTVSPFALVREIREWFYGPLALSGAIAHGDSILAALAAGPISPMWVRCSSRPPRLDPDALGEPGTGSGSLEFLNSGEAKVWRDIWGAGHGIGAVTDVRPTAAVVDRLAAEYARARQRLAALG